MAQLYTPTQEHEVVKYTGFEQVNQDKLKAAINASFKSQGKELLPDYFNTVKPSGIYVIGDYVSGAITRDLEDASYLCKFFVTPEFEGNGLAKSLLKHVLEDIGIEQQNDNGNSIILRTDPKNKKSNNLYLNEFFRHFGSSHDTYSSDEKHKWRIHQIGLKGEDLETKVKIVADLPITMVSINNDYTLLGQ